MLPNSQLLLYFNTIRFLRFRQFAYNFVRRLIKPLISASRLEASNSLSFILGIKYSNKIDGRSVCFLHERVELKAIADWQCLNMPKLWRYNLHYFDYLLDDGAGQEIKDQLINDWIKVSSDLKVDAWEPYVLSLRIVNWIKYFIHYKKNQVPEAWLRSLCQQASVLSRSIEYHILANHYLKNGKGLFFSGAYLKADQSLSWYQLGKQILLEQAQEQILADGGHYEKSPMYHCIVVEDYLDVINLIKSNKLTIDQTDMRLLENTIHSALGFLNKILMPDGNIPLFNDSAFGIAPTPAELFEYANLVMGYKRADVMINGCCALNDSGYFCISYGNSKLIVDCGSVSPDYQPGHTHCDMLSYELAMNGRRIIVDTGLHDYENSEARRYSRSTRAHNTIVIDDKEQSELWGQFRVARRAKVLTTNLFRNGEASKYLDVSLFQRRSASGSQMDMEPGLRQSDEVLVNQNIDCDIFIGSYAPYWGERQNIVHKRTICHSGNGWDVLDEITGRGAHKITNYIHLHPDLTIRQDGCYCYLGHGGVEFARIVFDSCYQVGYAEGWYYPEFGVKIKNVVITLANESDLPLIQHYFIEALH